MILLVAPNLDTGHYQQRLERNARLFYQLLFVLVYMRILCILCVCRNHREEADEEIRNHERDRL